MSKGLGVVGIGTDVGKTVVSAILAEALEAIYFKPIQAGDLNNSDRLKIQRWCSSNVQTLEEVYKLENAMAPHAAAELEGIRLDLDAIRFEKQNKTMLLEGAGGILVPLNDKHTLLDIYKKSGFPVVLISRNYLGSINHTLMTLEILKSHQIPVLGIIYTGEPSIHTESIIEKISGLKKIGELQFPNEINQGFIKEQSEKFLFLAQKL